MTDETSPAPLRYDTVTLLSDLGVADGAVGVLHSVIRQLAPGVDVVDLGHEVAPFDVRGASLLLARSVQYLSPGVVLALVGSGAGATRRCIAVEVADGAAVIMGPDNGVIAPAVGMVGGAGRAVVLDNPDLHLPTDAAFAASRDVFAAAAAHLCAGVPFEHLGSSVDPSELLPGVVPLSTIEDGVLSAEVLWVDRFGNAQLNVDPDDLADWGEVVELRIGGTARAARRVAAYDELSTGELGLLVDAHGLVTIVSNAASAATDLEVTAGDAVELSELDGGTVARGVTTAVQLGRSDR